MSDAVRHTEVARDEAAAEAGPGAATTNAPPTNQLTDDIEHNSTSSDSTPLEERSKGKIALIMTALGMAVFLAALDVTIITTALPTISEYFHSSAGYTWIGSAYLLGNASSVPLWGKISDIFGRKPILICANVLFLIGSLIAALANSIGMLITARAIQGVGGGGLVTLVNICISDLFSLRRRGAYFGIIGGVWALASAIGPVIGGVFTEKVTWRWCFYINLPLDGAALIIIFFFLDLKTPKTPLWEGLKAIDWSGALLVIGGVLLFLFGLEYGGVTYPWDSATVLCLIIIGVFTMGLFVINEWKFAKSPVMPLRIFQNRSNIAVLGVCAIHGMVFISASYYLPLYFQAARGATPLLSGVYILPQALSLSFASMATGIFIRKTGQYLPAIWFGMTFLVLGFGLFIDFTANSSWAKLIIFQIIAGIGIGPNFQAPLIALQTGVQPRDIATATATFGFVRQIFTSISVVIGQTVYQNQMNSKTASLVAALGPKVADQLTGGGAGANTQLIDSLPHGQKQVAQTAFAQSLHPMWIMYTCFAALGLVVSLFIKKKELSKKHTETKTGLDAQRANAEAQAQEDAEKKYAKEAARERRSHDPEQGEA
ncbi:putative major facilitator superfamily transporter [Aureobasidium melanogenum CBS 110374]|uniref:Efflux pump dotC n=1 Tax=Aureobasidium melanogenum (strain CBS 110374) TaxID=1043003 RepID=A0A074W1H5_AURM1|nr:putative major facilitator superfamily transporter [Aureobasidium melanogenum CBS 110374]KEQ65414.1 putative major facilitator superfamily transporter [Aureobasidium melanogenum CBS 110374]